MKASHTLENNTENGSDFKQSNLKHEFFFHGNLKLIYLPGCVQKK